MPILDEIVTRWDHSITTMALAAGMAVAWSVGRWASRHRPKREAADRADKHSDLVLALLGLLLAFTFSISVEQHDTRRSAVVEMANAIGDFSTCTDLLAEPSRSKLREQVRAYVNAHVEFAQPLTDEELRRVLAKMDGLHTAMQAEMREAVVAGTQAPQPLIETFNGMTSCMAARLAARRTQLPGLVLLVLVVASILSMALLGWQSGHDPGATPAGAAAFIVLVSLVVWVTLDLNRPYEGWIRVDQEPMTRLLQNLGR